FGERHDAEGEGFEPSRRRQPPTAFRVPRTRPDYATPPDIHLSKTASIGPAEGEGFEPSRGRKPPTAFPVPRTRPDYAIPPCVIFTCIARKRLAQKDRTPPNGALPNGHTPTTGLCDPSMRHI